MKVTLLLKGKTTDSYLKTGMDDYAARIGRYVNFEVVELKDSQDLLKKIKPSDHLVLLDENGNAYDSVSWARHLESFFVHSSKDLVFAVGGPYGFTAREYARGDEMVSLSKMTFSHQLVRVIFLEQLYRAMTIIKGEPYHHQ
ncbi:MAG: 23S rRNA (pseudouridine(1915)-N(3))-methyltransferase RlmH [Bacteroidales bacterium]|jgi:23S rRNA (pseudouridine1915-N3)-methyltransferase|nr:23S rRNA (pseudouridine(1915)-N(3))-methyltransferase RlmH [Bacteroidales bacterium]MCI2145441.1 23S rRNA (pseudouridine(1915)-N(3))-methyltransferase RlmH [Bacteroidales bacterium]